MCQDDTKWESSTGLWSPRCLQLRDFTNQLRAMRIKSVSTLFQRDTITMLTARLFSVIFSLWCDNLPQSPSPSHALERTWKNVPGFSNRGMFVQLWSDYGWIGKVMSKRCTTIVLIWNVSPKQLVTHTSCTREPFEFNLKNTLLI